jgi:short-subunit dehydrogenase
MQKLALITGATGGIGCAIAQQLVSDGYTLILHGRSKSKLDQLSTSLGGQHHVISADIAHAIECKALVEEAFGIGKVSLLINNAGVSHFGDFSNKEAAKLYAPSAGDLRSQHLMQVNLIAPILISEYFIERINSNEQATIINVGSALGSIGMPGFSLYCASKFGLRGFSETLSREYADTNIRVAYFAPRTTNTHINSSQALNMNKALNNKVDSPQWVAKQFMSLLHSKKRRKFLGWPEKLFARINGLFPELVDLAFKQKTQKIKQFTKTVSGDIT